MTTTTETPSVLDKLVEILGNRSEIAEDLAQYRAEHEYLMTLASFKVGDRVVLTREINFANAPGWRIFREVLVPGATGTVSRIEFSRFGKPGWRVLYKPEVGWSRLATPMGDLPNRSYHACRPTGDDHTFHFVASDLRAAYPTDKPLTRPSDAKTWAGVCSGCRDFATAAAKENR